MKSLAYSLLAITALATNLVSDLMIRSHDAHLAHQWDVACSVTMAYAAVLLWHDRRDAE